MLPVSPTSHRRYQMQRIYSYSQIVKQMKQTQYRPNYIFRQVFLMFHEILFVVVSPLIQKIVDFELEATCKIKNQI